MSAPRNLSERRLGWIFAGGLAVLLAAGFTAYSSLTATVEAYSWRNHSRQVLAALDKMLNSQVDVETSERGYIITGQPEYLAQYQRAQASVPEVFARVKQLTSDNPAQQRRLAELEPLLWQKLALAREVVELRRIQGFEASQARLMSGEGRRNMEQVRQLIATIEEDEQRLLTQREDQAAQDEQRSATVVIASNLLALVVVAVTGWFMVRNAIILRGSLRALGEQEWLQSGLAGLGAALRADTDAKPLARNALERLATLLEAPVGALYQRGADGSLALLAGYALESPRRELVPPGEGLIGQAVDSRRIIDVAELPAGYLPIASSLGSARPARLAVVPLIHRDQVEGVLELGAFHPWTPIQLTFLERAGEAIATALAGARSLAQIKELLRTSQQQEEELRVQQEELGQTNHELEEQARLLAHRNQEVEEANRSIEEARRGLERQAQQLALTSKYKSEFLSNMSHELRTPLNSLLILSQQLYENPQGNLDERQVRYARTINSSGNDLLTLINDILDLAKIESGTVTVNVEEVRVGELHDAVERTMRPLAESRGLDFSIRLGDRLPPALRTDRNRLLQVLKNLLANAIKFTPSTAASRGRVTLSIELASSGWTPGHPRLEQAGTVVAFAVSDTGVGIPADKQQIIFEAFQQADGTVNRKFGGTGLGLSISRELARLLGGELGLVSTVGVGSTFTLYVPLRLADDGTVLPTAPPALPAPALPVPQPQPQPQPAAPGTVPSATPTLVEDDRDSLAPGDRVALIVEDDPAFARILVELAREHGFKAVASLHGAAVPALARELRPVAITLDIHLADINGWHLLDRLKHDPATRHIPVHVITVEDGRERALRQGALGALTKPASREALAEAFGELARFNQIGIRHLLVVEDNPIERDAIVDTIGNSDVVTTTAADVPQALAALAAQRFDCIVLDLGLPGMSGRHLLEELHRHPDWREIPVIVYTARDLGRQEEAQLRRSAKTIVLKTAASLDRLLDETALFLHRVHSRLPEAKRQRIERIHQSDQSLAGKTVLVVDDDVRNVFALTSLLERYRMTVIPAENGREALAQLQANPAVAVVLMDLMMPEMDGFAAMRAIRANPAWQSLPIIALTAKAMQGDREQCLAAGASDYITKPVDTDQLLSMLRVWLYR
jgi:hypothetical protein